MKLIPLLILLIVSLFEPSQPFKTETKWVTDAKGKKLKKEEIKEYNSQGDVIKWVQYTDFGPPQPICEVFTYSYKNTSKIKKTAAFCNGKIEGTTIYTYDNLGRLKEEIEYDETHQLVAKRLNIYKGNSKNKAATEFYGTDGKKSSVSAFEYYPNNLLKKEVQAAGGSWFQRQTYKYDNNKHLIYEDTEGDGGVGAVGIVKYYYTYQGDVLVKDVVKLPDNGTEYHVYETVRN